MTMDRFERLIAKDEIRDNLARYSRGVDRRDWPAVRACYHDDATDWHGEFHGGADGFIEWVSTRHANVPFSMHFTGNCLIEFVDDRTAMAETYFVAMSRREAVAPDGTVSGTDIEVFGRYVDRFEKRADDVWRVADRKVVYDTTRTLPSTNHLRKVQGILGQRSREDAVYAKA
jgi:3-phenylpropionate/cinnamic acid dioxygenase small subunit